MTTTASPTPAAQNAADRLRGDDSAQFHVRADGGIIVEFAWGEFFAVTPQGVVWTDLEFCGLENRLLAPEVFPV